MGGFPGTDPPPLTSLLLGEGGQGKPHAAVAAAAAVWGLQWCSRPKVWGVGCDLGGWDWRVPCNGVRLGPGSALQAGHCGYRPGREDRHLSNLGGKKINKQ